MTKSSTRTLDDCFECYVMRMDAGDLYACPRHATPEQREMANKLILDLANKPSPFLAFMKAK